MTKRKKQIKAWVVRLVEYSPAEAAVVKAAQRLVDAWRSQTHDERLHPYNNALVRAVEKLQRARRRNERP